MWLLAIVFLLIGSRLADAAASPAPARSHPTPHVAPAPGEAGLGRASIAWLRLRVLTQIEPGTGITAGELDRIMDEIQQIWQPYVAIDVRPPTLEDGGGADDEVHLVFTNRLPVPRAAPSEPMAIAWTEFVGPETPGKTLSASVEAVRQVLWPSKRAGRSVGDLPASAGIDWSRMLWPEPPRTRSATTCSARGVTAIAA